VASAPQTREIPVKQPSTRALVAIVTACLALLMVVVAYAVLRLVQARLYPEPDPALVSWTTRIGLFWRLGLSVFIGVMLAPLGARWAGRDLAGALRGACWLAPLAALLIGAQALLVP
jgi:hypothetical protein